MKKLYWWLLIFPALPFSAPSLYGQTGIGNNSAAEVTIITDEADAVLAILSKETDGINLSETDWQKLFGTEGYTRLKKREHSMGRKFEDSTFRSFVLSGTLKDRYISLKDAIEKWKIMDASGAANQALLYLPENTAIKAKIYPVIKPAPNSFVFETDSDPAIFMYIDPAVRPEKLFNTLSHELHHIGIGSACDKQIQNASIPKGVMDALRWISGFSEGRAVLAASGGPNVHPHAVSDSLARSVWDRDFKNTRRDIKELEEFFQKLIEGKIPEKEIIAEGMKFVSREDIPQGAFYTVGWLMASTVEKVYGRKRLVASSCDGYMFMSDYNSAAKTLNNYGADLPTWSESLLSRLKSEK